jgi:VWFA-related protein
MVGKRHRVPYIPVAILLAAGVAAVCLSFAQEAQGPIRPEAPHRAARGSADRVAPSIRVDTSLVLVPVLVTDRQDRLITGLDRDHFRVFDDKQEQTITSFTMEDAPVSIGVVFDCSGSMGPKLRNSRLAVSQFLRTANPEDEFSLVTFSDHADLVVGFTDRIAEIENKLMFAVSNGRTALLDAIYLSMHEMKHAKHARKAILIISDGGDNCSRYSTREVKQYIRESDIQIYSIGILEPFGMRDRTPEEEAGPALLDEIARLTGGRLFEVDDLNAMRDVAGKIGAALRNQYMLGFMPADSKRDGKYHRIQVKIQAPKGVPPLRASFRSGYYGR